MSRPVLMSGSEAVIALDRIMHAARSLSHSQMVRVLRFVCDAWGIDPEALK